MINAMVSCSAVLVCDFLQSMNQIIIKEKFSLLAKVPILDLLLFGYADGKGFICQHCGVVRDKEEIRKIASEVKSILDTVLMSSSAGSILLSCLHWDLAFSRGNLII